MIRVLSPYIRAVSGLSVGVTLFMGQFRETSASLPNLNEMEFVRVEPGEFLMGCSPEDNECAAPEKPSRRVRIAKAFEIGRYEVTQAQWQAVMGWNPSHFKGENLPVEVSWNDTQQFLEKLNAKNDGHRYRLPTEAEWEFAARAGSSGSRYGELASIAWFDLNSEKGTHPVGQKKPNGLGIYDMLGNVSEWVQDWFLLDYYSTGPETDPAGPATGSTRVLRGGSWAGTGWQMRVSYRVQMEPSGRNGTMGFRCVREVG
jgi:formylglycine-generating enzyme required for sulfatase activity